MLLCLSLESHPFPPFLPEPVLSLSHQSHKSSIQISLFLQPVFLSGPSGEFLLPIRNTAGKGLRGGSSQLLFPFHSFTWAPLVDFLLSSLQGHSCHVPWPFYHIKNTWKTTQRFSFSWMEEEPILINSLTSERFGILAAFGPLDQCVSFYAKWLCIWGWCQVAPPVQGKLVTSKVGFRLKFLPLLGLFGSCWPLSLGIEWDELSGLRHMSLKAQRETFGTPGLIFIFWSFWRTVLSMGSTCPLVFGCLWKGWPGKTKKVDV